MSSFIKMGNNPRLTKSRVTENTSKAENFIELGDDSDIEEVEIDKNEHTPAPDEDS